MSRTLRRDHFREAAQMVAAVGARIDAVVTRHPAHVNNRRKMMNAMDIHSPHNACMYRAGCQQTQAECARLQSLADDTKDELDTVREAYAALRKDADRLTFMQENPKAVSRVFGYLGADDCWSARRHEGTPPQDFASLRDAIDAAMAAREAVGAA